MESASTTLRSQRSRKRRLISASIMFGVVSPSRSDSPCTPRKARSTCRVRRAAVASGPTRASEGVRTPPSRTTVCPVAGASWSTSAIRGEFVTTVMSLTRRRARASAKVVVPEFSETDMPGATIASAAAAMAAFSGSCSSDLCVNPGSAAEDPAGSFAPPWTFCSSPSRASRSRSRRTVMSDTPSSATRSATRTAPEARTRSRISRRRRSGSISVMGPPGSAGVRRDPGSVTCPTIQTS